jgi:AAA domain/Primase C terminal 2 (PriCT-2)
MIADPQARNPAGGPGFECPDGLNTCNRYQNTESPKVNGAPQAKPRYFYGSPANMGQVHALPAKNFKELVESVISKPVLLPISKVDLHCLPEEEQGDAKKCDYLTPAVFKSNQRKTENALCCNLIFVDIDEPVEAQSIIDRGPANLLGDYSAVVYHTARSRPGAPRLRVMVAANEVPVAHYAEAVRHVAGPLGLKEPNRESLIPVQAMYFPVIFEGDTTNPVVYAKTNGKEYVHTPTITLPRSQPGLSDDAVANIEFLREPMEGITPELAEEALAKIDPDCSMQKWVEYGMGLKHQFGDAGYKLWDSWSSKGRKYKPGETRKRWGSFTGATKDRRPITLRSVIRAAEEGGWQRPPHLKQTSSPPPTVWRVVSADQLCSSPPPTPPQLIRGLLYQKGTVVVSGPSKSHKTYTMLDAAQSVASGEPWLCFDTVQAPVLYLNLELQDFAVSRRLDEITGARILSPSPNLYIVNLRGEMIDLTALRANLLKVVTETKAKLVVIDPHYKISSAEGVEENSNDAQAKFLYEIETLCSKCGAAVMLAHHFAKGDASVKNAIDRAAGAGALARWPDVVMTLTEHEEPDCMVAEFSLRNFAPVKPFVVRWVHPLWQIDKSLNPSQLKRTGRTDLHPPQVALQHLGSKKWTLKRWANSLRWPETTLRRKVAILLSQGHLIQKGNVYSKP